MSLSFLLISHSEGHDFDLNDPSTINEEEAELIATMRAADTDGDGTISLLELSKMGSQLNTANRLQKHYKKIIFAFGFLFVVICFLLIGLVAAGVQMTKESRVPQGTGSSASVTTTGKAVPGSSTAGTETTSGTSSRRLGSSYPVAAAAPFVHTRRTLAEACPVGYDCSIEPQAKIACEKNKGTWIRNDFRPSNWCASCDGGPCATPKTEEEKSLPPPSVVVEPFEYKKPSKCQGKGFEWVDPLLSCDGDRGGFDESCTSCLNGGSGVLDLTPSTPLSTEQKNAMKDPKYVLKNANPTTVAGVQMTWKIKASGCLPKEILESVVGVHVIEQQNEEEDASSLAGRRFLADDKDIDGVKEPGKAKIPIAKIDIVDSTKVKFTDSNGYTVTLTQNALELDAEYDTDLEKMGISARDGTRALNPKSKKSIISNEDGEGSEIEILLEVNKMPSSINFDKQQEACMAAKTSAMVVPRRTQSYKSYMHEYKVCDAKLDTSKCTALPGIVGQVYEEEKTVIIHMKDALGSMVSHEKKQNGKECLENIDTAENRENCKVTVSISNEATAQTVTFDYEKQPDKLDPTGVARASTVDGKMKPIKNCRPRKQKERGEDDATARTFPQRPLLSAEHQTSVKRRLSHEAAHPEKRRQLASMSKGTMKRRLGRAEISSFDANLFTKHAIALRDIHQERRRLLEPKVYSKELGTSKKPDSDTDQKTLVYIDTEMDERAKGLGKTRPAGTAGRATVLVTDDKSRPLWTADVPVDEHGQQCGAPKSIKAYTEVRADASDAGAGAGAGADAESSLKEVDAASLERVLPKDDLDMMGDMACGRDMCGDDGCEDEPHQREEQPFDRPKGAHEVRPTAKIQPKEEPHVDKRVAYEKNKALDRVERDAEEIVVKANREKKDEEERVALEAANEKERDIQVVEEAIKVLDDENKVVDQRILEKNALIMAKEDELNSTIAELDVLEDEKVAIQAEIETATDQGIIDAKELELTAKREEISAKNDTVNAVNTFINQTKIEKAAKVQERKTKNDAIADFASTKEAKKNEKEAEKSKADAARAQINEDEEKLDALVAEQKRADRDLDRPEPAKAFHDNLPFAITTEKDVWDEAGSPDIQVCVQKGTSSDHNLIPGFEIKYTIHEDACLIIYKKTKDTAATTTGGNSRRVRRLSLEHRHGRTLNTVDEPSVNGAIDIHVTMLVKDRMIKEQMESLELGSSEEELDLGVMKQRILTDSNGHDTIEFYLDGNANVFEGGSDMDFIGVTFAKIFDIDTAKKTDRFPRVVTDFVSGEDGSVRETHCADHYSKETPTAKSKNKESSHTGGQSHSEKMAYCDNFGCCTADRDGAFCKDENPGATQCPVTGETPAGTKCTDNTVKDHENNDSPAPTCDSSEFCVSFCEEHNIGISGDKCGIPGLLFCNSGTCEVDEEIQTQEMKPPPTNQFVRPSPPPPMKCEDVLMCRNNGRVTGMPSSDSDGCACECMPGFAGDTCEVEVIAECTKLGLFDRRAR